MQALIAALQQQRNAALDTCAMLAAELEATKQRIKELESKKKQPKPRPSGPVSDSGAPE